MGFDLNNLNTSSAKAELCALNHPSTGTPLVNEDGSAWALELVSSDSSEYKRAQQTVVNRNLKESARRGKLSATAEQVDRDAIEVLVACTKGWQGLIQDGKTLIFSVDAARKLYQDYPWIREQASAFINERANFLGNS